MDYFSDIICVKEIKNPRIISKKTIENEVKRIPCKRRRVVIQDVSVPDDRMKKKKRHKRNVTLSEGEIMSEEELILSDISLSPDHSSSSTHKRVRCVESNRKSSDDQRSNTRVHGRKYQRSIKGRHRLADDGGSSDQSSPLHEHRNRKKTRETSHSKHLDHYRRSYHGHSNHRRYYSSPDTRGRSSDKQRKSKKHCKCETKREGKSKSPSDYFDENKFHGSDKSRIRTLKKKYDEYLRHAKKFKNEDQDSKHIAKFVELRSKLKGDESATNEASSIDYKKEEEKFLRSLETYLEIKKKQEKSMSSSASVPPLSSVNSKEYDPEIISSEEEEYVPENFTPEDMSLKNVEEYDPCNVSKASDASFTYQPTKIDEYEPIVPKPDEEYCPMPVEKVLHLTYNPTKKFGTENIVQSKQPAPTWIKPAIQYPPIPKQTFPNVRKKRSKMKLIKTKPVTKVISKNTVFIGNIVNPLALGSNKNNLVTPKTMTMPSSKTSIDKSKIMSKLVHEKLLEIEKKKLQLLEEINRKKMLKIKEKCDEVALRKLEKRKSDLMLEIFNSNIEKKTCDINTTQSNDENPSNINTEMGEKPMQSSTKDINVNKLDHTGSSNMQIKKENKDATIPANSIIQKLSALEKEKTDLMLEINRKLSINSKKVNKEKAELASKLVALEKNKHALLAKVKRKEAKQRNDFHKVVVKNETNLEEFKTQSDATTIKSTIDNPVKIEQEEGTSNEISVDNIIKNNNHAEVASKKAPNINKKLTELEQEKAKLLAQIAAKSNKVGVIQVEKEKPRLKILKPEALDAKLGKLAKEKEKLLMEIERKKFTTETQASVLDNNPKRKDQLNVETREITIKQEKEDMEITHPPKLSIKQEPKVNIMSHPSSSQLASKIKELEQQKIQLMKSLGNKLPLDKKMKLISNNENISNISKPKPVVIVELASKVKLKVNQHLSEINKKKMELMKQISAKSLHSARGAQNDSRVSSSQNVEAKLLELEKNKLKLLTEIEKKSMEKTCDKENVDDKSRHSNTNIKEINTPSIAPLMNLGTENVVIDVEIPKSHNEKSLSTTTNDVNFKIPEIPHLKNTNRDKAQKYRMSKLKIMKSKSQRLRMKTMLSQRKLDMIKRFRTKSGQAVEILNALKADSSQSRDVSVTISSEVVEPLLICESSDATITTKSESSNEPSQIDQTDEKNADGFEKSPPVCNQSNWESIQDTLVLPENRMLSMVEVLAETDSNPKLQTLLKNTSSSPLNSSYHIGETQSTDEIKQESLSINEPKNETSYVAIIETLPSVSKQFEIISMEKDDDDGIVDGVTEDKDKLESDNDYITLKVVKVEKPSDLDDEYDSNYENNDNVHDVSNQSDEKSEQYRSECEDKENGANDVDSNVNNEPASPGGDEEKQCDHLETGEPSSKGKPETILDITDDIVFVEEKSPNSKCITSYHKSNGKIVTNTLRMFSKISPSPVVSRLILNNKRKLISADSQFKKNNVLKVFQNAKSSVFVSTNSKKSTSEQSFTLRRCNSENPFIQTVGRYSSRSTYLNKMKTKKRKIDNRTIQNGKEEKSFSFIERKFRKNPSLYKLVNTKYRCKINSPIVKSTNMVHNKTSKVLLRGQVNGSNKSKYKLTNVCSNRMGESSVISKFKLVHDRTNTKLNKYKSLPPFIRRQVMSRFKLSNTNTASPNKVNRYSTPRRIGKSKYKISKLAESRDLLNSESFTPRKSIKSKYKMCRVNLRNRGNEQKEMKQESILRIPNRILRRASPSKNFLNYKSLHISASKSPSQHLVSKYKMIRISNQRERNKLNLSQRIHPNRSM